MAGLGRVLPPVDPLKAPSLGGERLPDVSHVTERPISDGSKVERAVRCGDLNQSATWFAPATHGEAAARGGRATFQRRYGRAARPTVVSIGDTFQDHNAVEACRKPPLRKDTEWKPNHHAFQWPVEVCA